MSELPFKARWFPFGPLFAFILCIVVIMGQNYEAFIGDKIDWYAMMVSYIGIPIFLALWLGYKWIKKTKVVKLHDCDFSSAHVRD